MNWGYKITFAFTAFVLFIGMLVFKSFQQNIDLVAEDYYQQELQYQQQIDKISNTQKLKGSISFSQQDQHLVIQFPHTQQHQLEGSIQLFRPSDARFDISTQLSLNQEQTQRIPTAELLKGHYKIKLDWTDGSKSYYLEESVYIH